MIISFSELIIRFHTVVSYKGIYSRYIPLIILVGRVIVVLPSPSNNTHTIFTPDLNPKQHLTVFPSLAGTTSASAGSET